MFPFANRILFLLLFGFVCIPILLIVSMLVLFFSYDEKVSGSRDE